MMHAAISRLSPHCLPRQVPRAKAVPARSMASAGTTTTRIIGISGSLRATSRNTALLKAASRQLPPGVSFEILDIGSLPLYNNDLWGGLESKNDDSALPEVLRTFRAKVAAADAVMFSGPEYNASVTAPLKNAIDWASLGPNLWYRKLVTSVHAGGGALGARSALGLQGILINCGAVFPPWPSNNVMVSAFGSVFDKDGNVVDEVVIQRLEKEVARLTEWSAKYKQIF